MAAAAAADLRGMDRFHPSLAAQLGFWLLTSAAYFLWGAGVPSHRTAFQQLLH